jgi:hypothetical protein
MDFCLSPSRERRRVARLLSAVVGASLLFVGMTAAVLAAPGPQADPRSLAVSVPPDPLVVVPGNIAIIPLRVVNPGTAPVNVTISGRALEFADNGGVSLGSGPDPWQGLVDFPAGPLLIPAQGYTNVLLSISIPAEIIPDMYFVGFVVTPEATGLGNVKVVNQIGSFVTLDVPGPRVRRLEAVLSGPSFVLGSRTQATLHVRNVGQSAAQFWGESNTTSSFDGGTSHQQRIDKKLAPASHARSFVISGKPKWPMGFVTMTVQIIYPDHTDDSTTELNLSKRVLVINPIAPVSVLVIVFVLVAAYLLKRRSNRLSNTIPSRKDPGAERRDSALL